MKIGILTFHNADNYGAVLQCYALQEHLKSVYPNDDVRVIDYTCKAIHSAYRFITFSNSKNRPFFRHLLICAYRVARLFVYFPQIAKRKLNFSNFRRKYLRLGDTDFSSYDVIYYGSDQIWRKELTGGDKQFFGKGFAGVKIAYGASDGGSLVLDGEISKFIKQFKSISCRENSLTQKMLPIIPNAHTVCDPVLLLNANEWKKIAVTPKEKDYILVYKVSENQNIQAEAQKLSELTGKKVIEIVYKRDLKNLFVRNEKYLVSVKPEKFVGYVQNASYVVTTSFHGTAFSILFRKNFFVLRFKKASERITDLLSRLSLEDRFVESLPLLKENLAINYSDDFERHFENFRLESETFLKDSLTFKNCGGGYRCLGKMPKNASCTLREAA